MALEITSPAFRHGGSIPERVTCEGNEPVGTCEKVPR